MLSDWYFCYCIGSNPDQTRTFLSILNVFESPDSDHVLLDLGCSELSRSDIWMQIYALPYVLNSLLRSDLSNKFHENVKQIYQNCLQSPYR